MTTRLCIRVLRSGSRLRELLANDDDPQHEALSVVAVSEPSDDGVLSGTLAGGFTYTPSGDARFVDTDHGIDYLVIDTAGHVTQGLLTIRILAAGDTNHATGCA